MSVIDEASNVRPSSRSRLRHGLAVAGFALVSGAIPVAVLASPATTSVNLADCAIGWVWDPVAFVCVPYIAPIVGPVGVDPILGPVGPVGVGRR